MPDLSVTAFGSRRLWNAASRPATRSSNRTASPGYPAAVTIATCTCNGGRFMSSIRNQNTCAEHMHDSTEH